MLGSWTKSINRSEKYHSFRDLEGASHWKDEESEYTPQYTTTIIPAVTTGFQQGLISCSHHYTLTELATQAFIFPGFYFLFLLFTAANFCSSFLLLSSWSFLFCFVLSWSCFLFTVPSHQDSVHDCGHGATPHHISRGSLQLHFENTGFHKSVYPVWVVTMNQQTDFMMGLHSFESNVMHVKNMYAI